MFLSLPEGNKETESEAISFSLSSQIRGFLYAKLSGNAGGEKGKGEKA